MIVRVKYDPDLGMQHPHVNDLPTWSMIGYDPIELTMVVNAPDDDFPPDYAKLDDLTFTETHIGPVLHGAGDDFHEAWHRHLNQRYTEHAGEFKPQLA